MPNHAKEPYVKTPNKKFRDIYSPNRKLFQKLSAKAKFLWKFSEARGGLDRFFKKEFEDRFRALRSVRIPNSNSNFLQNHESFYTSFLSTEIFSNQKSKKYRSSAFGVSKFQFPTFGWELTQKFMQEFTRKFTQKFK
jgi:hypothetical protein